MGRIMKILGIIIILALLLGSGEVAPVVAASGVTVSIDAPAQTTPDSDFTANVNISEVVDFDACNYDISFDASVLRLDNAASGLIDSITIPVDMYNEISPGTWRIVQNVPGLTGTSGSGYLAVLHFHVIGSADDSKIINLSNGVLSNNMASEITATWTGGSVKVATAISEETTPPTAASSPPEETIPPTVASSPPGDITPPAVNSAPEVAVPNKAAPPAEPINWPVLWGIINGVVVAGLIIFLIARRKVH